MISCAAPNVNIALAIGPTILIPLMLFGGLFLQNSTIPVWLEWLKYLSWFMYTNEALLINQWKYILQSFVYIYIQCISSDILSFMNYFYVIFILKF